MELLNNTWENINEMVACKQIFTGNDKAPIMNLDGYEGWNFNSGNYLFTTDTK